MNYVAAVLSFNFSLRIGEDAPHLIVDLMSRPICSEIVTAIDPLCYGQSESTEIHYTLAHLRVLVDLPLQLETHQQ